MATVDETGITPTSLYEYKTMLDGRFRDEFGASLNVEPETPAGQIISVMALSLTESDESVVNIGNAMSLASAAGNQLDDLASLLHVDREGETFTEVDCTIAGVSGTTVAKNSKIKTLAGEVFLLKTAVTIGATGTVTGRFVSSVSGPVQPAAGQINTIVDLIPGWETVTNPAAPTDLGRKSEDDSVYRNRYRESTARNACTPKDALKAELIGAGATRVRIEQNDTAASVTRQGLQIAARGVMAIVLGGETSDIADAVLNHKPLGVTMSGNTAVADSGRFQRVVETPIVVTMSITTFRHFPADGLSKIKQALVDYSNGVFRGGPGQFEVDGFQIGDAIDTSRFQVPAFSVAGHKVTAFTVQIKGPPLAALPATPNLNVLYTLAAADITITPTASN